MSERIGIQLELETTEDIEGTLSRIENSCKRLGAKKTMINVDGRGLVAIEDRIKELQDRLTALRAAKKLGLEVDSSEIKKAEAELRLLQRSLKNGTAGARSLKQEFKSMSASIAHFGGALQTLGNALTRVTSPFTRIATGAMMGVGYKALNSFTSGLENGFNRYDTMKKFPKIMEALGFNADEAEASVRRLDLSVRGLPTGLDEMVDLTQRFTSTVGDLDKGTKLAIATNNAFLASMSTDTQRYQGMMQLQDVLGGKNMTAREWNSLVSSMPAAIYKMGESLGYTDKNMNEFIQTVRDGKMDNQDFINQLIKIGTEGGVLSEMAQKSKDTWQAFFANVGNAASRMTAGIVEALDEVSRAATGKDANMLLIETIIPGIDNMTESVKKWIRAHPEEITNFFKALGSLDWKGFAKGFAQEVGNIADMMVKLGEAFNGKGLSWLGRGLVKGRMAGILLTLIGGIVRGTRHIWPALFLLGRGIGRFLSGRVGKFGIFGALGKLFGRRKDILDAGNAAKDVPTVSQTFRSAFKSLEGLIKAAGAVVLVAGTGAIAFKSVKSMVKDLKEIGEALKEFTWLDYVTGANIILGIGVMTKVFEYVGKVLGKQGTLYVALTSLAGVLVGGALATMMWEIKTGLKQLKEAVTTVEEIGVQLSTFSAPKIDVGAITKTIGDIDQVFAALTGKGRQTMGSRLGRATGFFRNPVGSLLGGLFGGAKDAFSAGAAASKYSSMLGALGSLKQVVAKINSIGNLSINEGAVENIGKISEGIDAVLRSVNKALPGGRKAAGLEKISGNVMKTLGSLSTMASTINSLARTSVNTSGFATFVLRLKEALDELKSVEGDLNLNIRVKLNKGFESSVQAVIKQIKAAKKKISNLKKPIKLTIPVRVRFSVTTNVGSALSVIWSAIASIKNAVASGGGYRQSGNGWTRQGGENGTLRAMGGAIYRAGGGSALFPGRPIGTDRVPAWLTEGEYVHRKQAVNYFGLDFMRKVNSLDMRGAIDALMHRAGGIASGASRGTTINNTYNNNQKVVQNIRTNSPDFAFRTASRFVGAF